MEMDNWTWWPTSKLTSTWTSTSISTSTSIIWWESWSQGLVNWAQTFSTQCFPGLRIFLALQVYYNAPPMLQILNTCTIVLQMSTWHQWRRQGNWLQPKPGLRPPKAARQSDRFVKTWLESLSGRRWGGNLGWMEFKIHLLRAEKQTGRRRAWQRDWLQNVGRPGGQTTEGKMTNCKFSNHNMRRKTPSNFSSVGGSILMYW